MRKRVLLIAAPLLVVAIATSVAVAAPSSAEHSRGPRLDKLHAERPIAASQSNADFSVTDAGFQKAATEIQDYVRSQQVNEYLQALTVQAVGEYIASVQAAEAAQAAQATQAVATQRVSSAVSYSSHPGDFLSCVRNRESGGNYGIYNSGGSGAAGAYQFMPGTWNGIAASSGRADLVGVDPAQAAPADQDAMAQALYAQQGAAPWGGGC
jgi:muramidase (phage lysozyme)